VQFWYVVTVLPVGGKHGRPVVFTAQHDIGSFISWSVALRYCVKWLMHRQNYFPSFCFALHCNYTPLWNYSGSPQIGDVIRGGYKMGRFTELLVLQYSPHCQQCVCKFYWCHMAIDCPTQRPMNAADFLPYDAMYSMDTAVGIARCPSACPVTYNPVLYQNCLTYQQN